MNDIQLDILFDYEVPEFEVILALTRVEQS